MLEFIKNRKFTIGVVIMFVLIIIGLFSFGMPKYYYKSDPSKMIEVFSNDSIKISPSALAKDILNKNPQLVLVDIRSQFDYSNGNIEGSINIPANDILEDKYFNQLKDFKNQNKEVVLYGEDIVEANIPFMTLYPLGIDNLKLLQGGYHIFKNHSIQDIANTEELIDDEKSLNDINKFITEEIKKAEELGKAPVKVVAPPPAPKKVVVPVKHAAVEEEGC